MGLFKKLIKTTLHTVTSPIEVVKDAATLGGLLTDQDESYSSQRVKKISDDINEINDEIDEM